MLYCIYHGSSLKSERTPFQLYIWKFAWVIVITACEFFAICDAIVLYYVKIKAIKDNTLTKLYFAERYRIKYLIWTLIIFSPLFELHLNENTKLMQSGRFSGKWVAASDSIISWYTALWQAYEMSDQWIWLRANAHCADLCLHTQLRHPALSGTCLTIQSSLSWHKCSCLLWVAFYDSGICAKQ